MKEIIVKIKYSEPWEIDREDIHNAIFSYLLPTNKIYVQDITKKYLELHDNQFRIDPMKDW